MEHRQSKHPCCLVPTHVLMSNGWVNGFLGSRYPFTSSSVWNMTAASSPQCRVLRLSQRSLEQESLGIKFLHQSLKEVSLNPIPFPKIPGSSAGW